MIHDLNNLPLDQPIQAEVCIIGAGPAGLAVAMSLAKAGRSVCILEAGGLAPEPQSTELARVVNVGDSCFDPSHRRVFAFGGTTWMWSGWCRPFDAVDFSERPWVPHSGWPVAYEKVSAYFGDAASFLQLPDTEFDVDRLAQSEGATHWRVPGNRVETRMFRILRKTPRLGLIYRETMEQSEAVNVYCHAYVKYLEPAQNGDRIQSVTCCDSTGRTFRIKPKTVVLAAGAIDNPRLMLETQRRFTESGFRFSETLGRYFMLRPHASGGSVRSDGDANMDLELYNHLRDRAAARFFLTPETQREKKLLRYNVSFFPPAEHNGALMLPFALGTSAVNRRKFIAALAAAGAYLSIRWCGKYGNTPGELHTLTHTAEQAPNPASRILLSDEQDRYGMPRAAVDWHSLPIDRRSMYGSARLMAEQLNRWGKLSMDLEEFANETTPWPPDDYQGQPGHYMGTTRMGTHKENSVVDQDCLVHGVDNLYVAGSSVYPTSGNGTPTLTLVALALRLADKIAASN